MESFYKEILRHEAGFEVYQNRFLFNNYYYPINLAVFESIRTLGFFNPSTYEIGLNKKLIYEAKSSVLKDILRHEVAHLLTHLYYGAGTQDHGAEFQAVCSRFARFGWDNPKVCRASMDLDESNSVASNDLASDEIIEKIKKLLSLATSDNHHEAELATLKANDLLMRHHISKMAFNKDHVAEDETIYVKRILEVPRVSAKYNAIASILRTFMVYPVYTHGKKSVTLEVSGTRENVEIASYITDFLNVEFECLWNDHRKDKDGVIVHKGLAAKNSFFRGIAYGYETKIKNQTKRQSQEIQKALIVAEKQLAEQIQMVYPRLRSSTSYARHNEEAHQLGQQAGKSLSINKGVDMSSKNLAISQ